MEDISSNREYSIHMMKTHLVPALKEQGRMNLYKYYVERLSELPLTMSMEDAIKADNRAKLSQTITFNLNDV